MDAFFNESAKRLSGKVLAGRRRLFCNNESCVLGIELSAIFLFASTGLLMGESVCWMRADSALLIELAWPKQL